MSPNVAPAQPAAFTQRYLANPTEFKDNCGFGLIADTHGEPSHDLVETAIIGNTCLYGATGGKLFASGTAGERFGVRNSGAFAVVEGAGDHCCEYMTGGFAYVLDLEGDFFDGCNHELIDMHRISNEQTENHRIHLMSIIKEHVEKTGSQWGQTILDDFEHYVRKFYLVKPKAANIASLLKTTMADPQ